MGPGAAQGSYMETAWRSLRWVWGREWAEEGEEEDVVVSDGGSGQNPPRNPASLPPRTPLAPPPCQ